MIVYRDFWILLAFMSALSVPLFLAGFFLGRRRGKAPGWLGPLIVLALIAMVTVLRILLPFALYLPLGLIYGIGARKAWKPVKIIGFAGLYLLALSWLMLELVGVGLVVKTGAPILFLEHIPNAFLARVWQWLQGFEMGRQAFKLHLGGLFGITENLKQGLPVFIALACWFLAWAVYGLLSPKHLPPLAPMEHYKPPKTVTAAVLFVLFLGLMSGEVTAVNSAIALSWGLAFLGMGAIVFRVERFRPGVRKAAWMAAMLFFPFTPFRWIFIFLGCIDLLFDLRLPLRIHMQS